MTAIVFGGLNLIPNGKMWAKLKNALLHRALRLLIQPVFRLADVEQIDQDLLLHVH